MIEVPCLGFIAARERKLSGDSVLKKRFVSFCQKLFLVLRRMTPESHPENPLLSLISDDCWPFLLYDSLFSLSLSILSSSYSSYFNRFLHQQSEFSYYSEPRIFSQEVLFKQTSPKAYSSLTPFPPCEYIAINIFDEHESFLTLLFVLLHIKELI